MLEQIGIYVFIILFFILNTIFVLYKYKTFELIVLHIVIMFASLIVGVVYLLPIDNVLAIIFITYSIVSLIGNILMCEV